MVIAASELNMSPVRVNCGNCAFSYAWSSADNNWTTVQPTGKAAQADARVFTAYASEDLPIGRQIQVEFGGGGGARAVTVLAISAAVQMAAQPSAISGVGVGTAIGWSCTSTCTIAANLMMVSTSVISGGGSDSYTEDAAWTFLHQSAAGAWPTLRIAYKASGAGGSFSYGLTDTTSRSWISGAHLVK